MTAKEWLIRLSGLLPLLLFYFYPVDMSIHGKGVLFPSAYCDIKAPISGPLHLAGYLDGTYHAKTGDNLFEIQYSGDREQLLMGLRGPRISKVDNDIDRLERTWKILKKVHNRAFREEQDEILDELKKQREMKDELLRPQAFYQIKDHSVVLTAPTKGFLVRNVSDPRDGEYVNEGRRLGQFIQNGDLRIIVLYPYGSLPEIQAEKNDVELKVPGPNGNPIKLVGKPLSGPLMGMELWRYLQDTENYLTSVRTKENKQVFQRSLGVLYEVHCPTVDSHLLLSQEVEAKIPKPRILLISLLFHYSELSWTIFTQQFSREPLVALQCFLSSINFWLSLPFIPFTFYFAGMVPLELRRRYLESLEAHVPKDPLRISAVVPFFNEAEVLCSTIDSMARQKYPLEKIFLVDDGSTDDFFERLKQKYDLTQVDMNLFPVVGTELRVIGKKRDMHVFNHLGKEFVLIRKANAGKGYALNCGINRVQSDYVVTVDGDTLLDPDSILKLAWTMYKNRKIKVTHGRLGVMNNCVVKDGVVVERRLPRGYVELCQVVEYFGNGIYKTFHNALGIQTVIIGAFACFEIKILREIGGFHNRTIVEDQDIAYEIHKRTAGEGDDRENIIYVPQAIAWTQVPFNWKNLYRQRLRWAGGSLDTLMKHSDMIFKPKYGWLSLYSMPVAWFQYVVFWITLPLNAFGVVGLGVNMYLLATSDTWRWLVHYFFIYFFIPSILLRFYFYIYDFIYLDEKYIRSWNRWQKFVIFIFARIGSFIFGYVLSYFRFIGQMKAIFGKLRWDKIERKAVRA